MDEELRMDLNERQQNEEHQRIVSTKKILTKFYGLLYNFQEIRDTMSFAFDDEKINSNDYDEMINTLVSFSDEYRLCNIARMDIDTWLDWYPAQQEFFPETETATMLVIDFKKVVRRCRF